MAQKLAFPACVAGAGRLGCRDFLHVRTGYRLPTLCFQKRDHEVELTGFGVELVKSNERSYVQLL